MPLEPLFNVDRRDCGGFALTGGVLAAFVAQGFAPVLFAHLGLSAAALAAGLWWTPVTHMFVHGGLMHVAVNAIALLSFSRPLARRIGGLRLIALFLLSGLAGAATFLAFNPEGYAPMVGASGAVFGFWGAAARLGPVHVGAAPLFSRPVAGTVLAVVVLNLLTIALYGGFSSGESGIAWEAHLGGFLFGLLAGPLFVRRSTGP